MLSLEKFLLHGLKSNRLFQRNVFVWDFVGKYRECKLINSDVLVPSDVCFLSPSGGGEDEFHISHCIQQSLIDVFFTLIVSILRIYELTV